MREVHRKPWGWTWVHTGAIPETSNVHKGADREALEVLEVDVGSIRVTVAPGPGPAVGPAFCGASVSTAAATKPLAVQ